MISAGSVLHIPFSECPLSARILSAGTDSPRAYVFYLHGGGLIFGTRDDLPAPYISMLTNAGFTLVMLDYPLAPESALRTIREAVHFSVTYLLNYFQETDREWNGNYVLFGRSAGAYLALKETERLLQGAGPDTVSGPVQRAASNIAASVQTGILPLPRAILSFYGYHRFDLPEFNAPSPAFLKYAPVSESTVKKLIGNTALTEGPLSERYSIYVYARQQGCWPSMAGAGSGAGAGDEDSVSEEMLKHFPPVFFTAGTSDEDVPFRESKQLSRLIPESKFVPVYYANHDFDRDLSRKEGAAVYTEALVWLNKLL